MSDLNANQIKANKIVSDGVAKGDNAKTIIATLGQGGHLSLSGAVKRLGLKPSKPGVVKGKYTAFAPDTTFSAA